MDERGVEELDMEEKAISSLNDRPQKQILKALQGLRSIKAFSREVKTFPVFCVWLVWPWHVIKLQWDRQEA